MRVSPNDQIKGLNGHFSVLDFWQWAFADLCDDDIKGWYAEWLVGNLLGLFMGGRRISWANSDLISPGKVRIEVKASSFWQSWKLLDEFGKDREVKSIDETARKRVRFAGLNAGDAVEIAGPITGNKSDLYVFAFQNQLDHAAWNALDLTQWEFYLLTKEQLAGKTSISLTNLAALCPAMTADELRTAGRNAIREKEGDRCDLLETTTYGQRLSSSVFLKDGVLTSTEDSERFAEMLAEHHVVGSRVVRSYEEPEEWFRTLPIHYSGTYCRAVIPE